MQSYKIAALMLAFSACCAFAAEDVASAVVVTVKAIDHGAKTVTVKTAEGTEHTIRFTGRTIAHGAEATGKGAKDAFLGMKEGDEVIIHYTLKGADKVADEVDHIGKDGLKMTVVSVKSVDHAAKTVTVKTGEGAEETYHLTDRAAKESGKGLEKTGKVTVYYSEDAGKKVAHFFKAS
jgi:Cu/Ag efflux protein CusF